MLRYLTLSLCALLFCGTHLYAQDLSGLSLQAHYSFLNTADETNGSYGAAELVNAPFVDTCGVFSYGGYLFDTIDEDSSFVGTPQIGALNDAAFAVQVEFKVDSVEMRARPVIVVGDSWRYIGLFTQFDGTFAVLHNDALYQTDAPVSIEAGRWHTCTITYSTGNETARYYIDGALIFSRTDTLVRPDYDTRVTNTHGGFGWTFRGYWRNLKVYSSNTTTSIKDVRPLEEMDVSPNPSNGAITINMQFHKGKDHVLCIYDMQGRLVRSQQMNDGHVAMADLPPGALNILCYRKNRLVAQQRILVTRQ